jgi:putative acetyltransferase
MTIRPETRADLPAIDRIHVDAFRDHPYSHQTEHLIVRALRAAGALTLSLVAERDGQVVGHIAFSPALIEARTWDGSPGPVSCRLPGERNRPALIHSGLQVLRALPARGCPSWRPVTTGASGSSITPLRVHGVPPDLFLRLFRGESLAASSPITRPSS